MVMILENVAIILSIFDLGCGVRAVEACCFLTGGKGVY